MMKTFLVLVISKTNSITSFVDFYFSLWCLNPAVGFSFMKEQKPLSVILTSGTLTPFNSFESELQLEFPIQLINKHVIDTKSRVNPEIL